MLRPGIADPTPQGGAAVQNASDAGALDTCWLISTADYALDETGQVLLIQGEGRIALLAGSNNRQVRWIRLVDQHSRWHVIASLGTSAAIRASAR